jgi:hypothetical protein
VRRRRQRAEWLWSMSVCRCVVRRYSRTGIVDLSGGGLCGVGVAQQTVGYDRLLGGSPKLTIVQSLRPTADASASAVRIVTF